MRWMRAFIPTLKEDPQDAEAVSHKLMVRAALIRRLTAGAYTYLPLGYKVLQKAEKIVREEMNAAGAIELLMPALQQATIPGPATRQISRLVLLTSRQRLRV